MNSDQSSQHKASLRSKIAVAASEYYPGDSLKVIQKRMNFTRSMYGGFSKKRTSICSDPITVHTILSSSLCQLTLASVFNSTVSIVSVYHHWDGYPQWLGVQLTQKYRQR